MSCFFSYANLIIPSQTGLIWGEILPSAAGDSATKDREAKLLVRKGGFRGMKQRHGLTNPPLPSR